MKIAISFKNNEMEYYVDKLKKNGFDISVNGFNTLWVYNLSVVYTRKYSSLNKLVLETKSDKFETIDINIEDIEYYEVHKQND